MSDWAALAAALAAAPRLPGAACKGRYELFDPAEPGEDEDDYTYRDETALAICRHCPALTDCQSWLETLPPRQQPPGVIAGRITSSSRTESAA